MTTIVNYASKLIQSVKMQLTPAPPVIKVVLLSSKAKPPHRASPGAAGYDLYSAETVKINPTSACWVKTDLAIEMPENTYGRVAARSGIAKKFIGVGAGVLDRDYTGNVMVLIYNHNNFSYTITQGERMAQLIPEKVETPEVVIVDKLTETVRGKNGFGSTGVH